MLNTYNTLGVTLKDKCYVVSGKLLHWRMVNLVLLINFNEFDFINTNNYYVMNVLSAARLFSGRMKKIRDNII